MAMQCMNVILYCRAWHETVDFYRDVLRLPSKMSADWLVEFEVRPGASLSVADAKRTTVSSAGGTGITVTFKVEDVDRAWQDLRGKGAPTDPIRESRLGGRAFFLRDPEGHRLEFWSETPQARANPPERRGA